MSVLTADLRSHLALVTGASGGIGKATCLALAELGCSIAAHYYSNANAANELVDQLKAKGVKAQAFQADLSNYDGVRTLHQAVTSTLGAPAVLFNNAGTTLSKSRLRSASDVTIEEFETTWRSNCGTAFLLTQLCLPAMESAGWGRVIFCSSVAGLNGGIVGPHYASSKSALHGLVHWLAGAYAGKGITVNGIAPALIQDTAMLPGSNEELAKRIPVGRLGKPEEIAETVVWMVKTGYLTNKIIGVDGGFFAH
ncbi:3-oxoacyl-reductase [Macrophomina phaseolina]|uniref:3-oxoacyl-[acyl-carrier-protein] reductase n=1 Tax=Macrophomina phaseolina TaxID=35725 RepID=A0ABQ8G3P9_9PEZI|nr:3-oxoacyl-reductase [Macrophomina phaseolina]